MSWLTVAWSMACAACATLAVIHLAIWFGRRSETAHLLFALTALGGAGNAAAELVMLQATTVELYASALRASFVPIALLVISMVWYVRKYFGNGRRSLAWAVTAAWAAILLLDTVSPYSPVFREITRLKIVPTFWGEPFAVAEGVTSPLHYVITAGDLLLALFVVDAGAALWRLGRRRRAVLIGAILVVILAAVVQARLVDTGVLRMPYVVTFVYLGIVAALGYPLTSDVARVAEMGHKLQASEAGLRESETRLRLAARAANLDIWTWDVPRDEIWMTPEGRALRGFSESEPIGYERFSSVVHPEDRELLRRLVARSLSEGGEFEGEYRVVRPDGELRWIALRGAVERDRGSPRLVRGVSLDITQRKQAELEALQHRNDLAHLSRVMLVGELSGSVAHELNQPLTAVLSNAQAAQRLLAREGADSDEVKEILTDVVDDVKRAAEVIRRLRLLLKKGELHRQPLNVNEVVLDVLGIVRNDLVSQGVTVKTDLASDLPPVNADRVQLQQVVLNLIVNGCDAMAGASATDRLLAIRTDRADRGARVSVSDTGGGIPPDQVEKVFEHFHTTKKHGMGLGLAICRTIVSAHGGRIWVAPSSGPGATFQFELPAIAGEGG